MLFLINPWEKVLIVFWSLRMNGNYWNGLPWPWGNGMRMQWIMDWSKVAKPVVLDMTGHRDSRTKSPSSQWPYLGLLRHQPWRHQSSGVFWNWTERLTKRNYKIPIMHDDQHGTAIISACLASMPLNSPRKKNWRCGDCRRAGASVADFLRNCIFHWEWKKENIIMSTVMVLQEAGKDLDRE